MNIFRTGMRNKKCEKCAFFATPSPAVCFNWYEMYFWRDKKKSCIFFVRNLPLKCHMSCEANSISCCLWFKRMTQIIIPVFLCDLHIPWNNLTIKYLHQSLSEVFGGRTVTLAPPTSCTLAVEPRPMGLPPIGALRALRVTAEAPPPSRFLAGHWWVPQKSNL